MRGYTTALSRLLRALAVLAIAVTLSVAVFFVYTLALRNEYKQTALRINDAVLAHGESAVIRQGDTFFSAPTDILDYYDRFLLDGNTVVYSRQTADETNQTITIDLGDDHLSFTGLEDGFTILINWTTPGGQKTYRVRSMTTFMQLNAYFQNFKRRMET